MNTKLSKIFAKLSAFWPKISNTPRSAAFGMSLVLMSASQQVTADELKQSTPELPIHTQWVGNTWGGWTGPLAARPTRSWAMPAERSMRVQQGFWSVALASDGTVFTTGRGEGRASGFFRNGVLVGQMHLSQHHASAGQAIAVDDKYVYVSVIQPGSGDKEDANDYGGIRSPRQGTNWGAVGRFTHGGTFAPFANGDGWFGQYKVLNDQGSKITGIASDGESRLYVSDTASNRVLALNIESMEAVNHEGTELVAESVRPGRIALGPDGDLWVIGRPSYKAEMHHQQVNCAGSLAENFHNDSRWRWRGASTKTKDPVDLDGVEDAGPEEIYQTAIEADQLGYRFRDYLPGAEVTIRLHFADFRSEREGDRVFSVSVNRGNNIIDPVLENFDIIAAAGGKNKAIVKTVKSTVGANGQIWVYIRAENGQRALLNAIEIEALRPTSEIDEPYIISRFDKNLSPKGSPVNMPEGMIPAAISFNPAGELVIADNGPDLCLKVYSAGAGIPDLSNPSSIFGEKGGVLGGAVPGKAGPLRFEYLTDIAYSADGRLAVASDGGPDDADIAGGSLRFFDSAGELQWIAEGYMFMDVPDWGVKNSAEAQRVLHSVNRSFDMDLNAPAGSNWAFRGFTVDRFRYPNDFRLFTNSLDRGNVYVSEVDGHRLMALTRSEQPVAIYRFAPSTHGEIAIPAAAFAPNPKANHKFPGAPPEGEWLWVDVNRDGQYDADEFQTRSFDYRGIYNSNESPTFHGFTMDERGGLWFSNDRHFIRYFPLQLHEDGLPEYTWESSRILAIPEVCHNKEIGRIAYDVENDRLYLSTVMAPDATTMTVASREQPAGRVVGNAILRLDGVMQAFSGSAAEQPAPAPEPTWMVEIPFNSTTVRSRHTLVDLPMAVSAVGDYVFVAYSAWGRVRAYRAEDGAFAGMMELGRSLKTDQLDGSGRATEDPNDFGLIDSPLSLRVMQQDGVYWIAFHDNFIAHTKVYRWEPGIEAPPLVDGLKAVPVWQEATAAISLSWPASEGADHYLLERAPANASGSWVQVEEALKTTSWVDSSNLEKDQIYFYRVRAVATNGSSSDYSNIAFTHAPGKSTISISFDESGKGAERQIHAGMIARPFWNHFVSSEGSGAGALLDDQGNDSGMGIEWSAPEAVTNERVDGSGDDHFIMSHALRSTSSNGAPVEIKVNNIPYERYSVYVYASNPMQQTQATVEANGEKVNLRQRDGNHFHGGFFPVQHDGYGNVAVIRGLEGKSLTINVTAGAEPSLERHRDEAAVAAVQIIAE